LRKAESARSKREKLVRNAVFFGTVICTAVFAYAFIDAQVDVVEADTQLAMAILQ
jgi:hypothetical protein